jgi:hypothetical protein
MNTMNALKALLRFWFWSNEYTRPEHIAYERIGKIGLWVIPALIIWIAIEIHSDLVLILGLLLATFAREMIIATNALKFPGREHSRDRAP